MSEMVERVALSLRARFMAAVEASAGKPFADTKVELPGMQIWRDYARAAIEAMREPTDEMIKAGAMARDEDHCSETNALFMWRDMVDVARGSKDA